MLHCSHFECVLRSLNTSSSAVPIAATVTPDGTAGRVLLMNSATTLTMLSEYHQTLLNHQSYAEYHHYAYIRLVKPSELEVTQANLLYSLSRAACTKMVAWPSILGHYPLADLDAWFATWAPFSAYADMWPRGLLLQIPVKFGSILVLCRPPDTLGAEVFDMVVNAVFSGVEHDDKLGHEWEKVHGHANQRQLLASNGISLLFGMFCLTHGPKMLRCHILARAVGMA